jgi:mannose-6-phosphate isomerase-like protein (cupin superfamily)
MSRSDDTGAVVVRAAEAELLELPGGSSIRLLADSSATQTRLSVHRASLRDGANGAGPHHHTTAAEVFYVINGSVQILVGTEVIVAVEGDLALVPPQVPHAFAATPGHDAELLVAVTPGIERFDLFRRLARVSTGAEPPGTLFEDQSIYDTYASDSPAWRRARHLD